MAVREGGNVADPSGNPRLRLAIDAARAANMPKDNIDRAIQRASGKNENIMEAVVYEGFGPGGFALIVEAITDNTQRTTPEMKNVFSKNGGNMGTPGSVSYQFEQKGLITVAKNGKTVDEIFLIAADSGAEDIEEHEEEVLVYTRPENLGRVRDELAKSSTVKTAELTRKPLSWVRIADTSAAQKAITFLEKIEDMDDVQKVYANFEIDESIPL